MVFAKIFNTNVNSEQLFAMINDDFGLDSKGKDKVKLLKELYDFLIEQYAKGNQSLLIVDEAQNFKPDLLEEIRMLSNLETATTKLLRIILVGQPELRNSLALPELRQLRQRISVSCRIHPLTREETEQYIFHRLEIAGNRGAVTFGEGCIDHLFRYSRGIPRLLNILCDFLLLTAFNEERRDVDIDMVQEIAGDLDFEGHFWGKDNGSDRSLNCTALINALKSS